ncbi:hypothetical protein AB0E69_33420 [Kribbella sp. NPDC026611]|uniref:hypothetical protein n=1 Tax=Kribbella sp. NPDC026611 TaxID=3154911 RepID=UPI0033DC75CD
MPTCEVCGNGYDAADGLCAATGAGCGRGVDLRISTLGAHHRSTGVRGRIGLVELRLCVSRQRLKRSQIDIGVLRFLESAFAMPGARANAEETETPCSGSAGIGVKATMSAVAGNRCS